jgi:hypothetical protein
LTRKTKSWSKILLLACALSCACTPPFAVQSAAAAASTETGAKTSPPPIEMQPQSVFNPNHLYLLNGTNSITAQTGKVVVSAATMANQVVDSIGITFYVQKWNGSSWVDVGSSYTMGGNQQSTYANDCTQYVEAGYYYRARTIHWVIENGKYEEGELFSASVLGQ